MSILLGSFNKKETYSKPNPHQLIPKLYFSVKKSNFGSQDFKKAFRKYGPLIHLYLCEKMKKGKFLYGFVWFRYLGDAQRVLQNSPLDANGVKITVRSVQEKDRLVFEFYQRIDQINRIEPIMSTIDFSLIPEHAFNNFRFWSYLEESIFSQKEEVKNCRLLFMIDVGHRIKANISFNRRNHKGSPRGRASF